MLVKRCFQSAERKGPYAESESYSAGKVCDSDTAAAIRDITDDTHTKTTYVKSYQADPKSYNPDNKKGGGYWLYDRTVTETVPLNADTTYKKEICDAPATTHAQLKRTDDLRVTLSSYEQARRQNEAGTLSTTGKNGIKTASGDTLGYVSSYTSMVLKNPLTGGSAAAGAERVPSEVPGFRCASADLPVRSPRNILNYGLKHPNNV